jgi:hypothetical protein
VTCFLFLSKPHRFVRGPVVVCVICDVCPGFFSPTPTSKYAMRSIVRALPPWFLSTSRANNEAAGMCRFGG